MASFRCTATGLRLLHMQAAHVSQAIHAVAGATEGLRAGMHKVVHAPGRSHRAGRLMAPSAGHT